MALSAAARRPVVVGVLASLVGLGFGAPHLLIPRWLAEPARYAPLVVTGVSFVTVDEAYGYGARVREVMDGRWLVSDPITWEHKGAWPFYLPPEQWMLGAVARALGGVPAVFVLADFLFPPIDFLLMAGFLTALTQSWLVGAAAALAILAGGVQHAVALALGVGGVGLGVSAPGLLGIVRPLEFSRLYVPELTFIPFVGALWAVWLALERRSFRWAIVAGVGLALLIPSYFYYWTFLAAGVGLLLTDAVVRRDAGRARVLGVVLVTGLALATPYFVSYALSMARPGAAETGVRFGVEHGRVLAAPSLKEVALIGLTALAAWRLRSRRLAFVLAFWIGYVLCRNLQLVTGSTVHSIHWGYRVGYVWQTMTIAVLVAVAPAALAARWPRAGTAARRLVVAGAILGLVIGPIAIAGHQVAFARNTAADFTLPDGYREAFEWLNRSTPRDSVVVTPSFETNMLLPVYTHANVFLPNGIHSMAPTGELVDRLCLVYKAFGVPTAYLAASLRDDPSRAVTMTANGGRFERLRPELLEQYALWYLFHRLRPSEEMLGDIVTRYDRLEVPAGRPFGPYRADYVWMSGLEATKGRIDLAAHPELSVVYRERGVIIARMAGR